MLEYIIQNRTKEQIAVITQDKGLSFDLLAMNSLESFEGRRVSVYRIDKTGNMIPFIRKEGTNMFIENAQEQVWLDKEAILNAGFRPFIHRYIQAQKETIVPVFIHSAVRNEIIKDNERDLSEASQAADILDLLHNLEEKGLLKVMGNPLEPFDSTMQYINAFIRNRIKFRIVFISNNKNLSESTNNFTSFIYTHCKANKTDYYASRYNAGCTLKEWIQNNRNKTGFIRNLLLICSRIAGVLQQYHKKGLMHLDVKPDNILVVEINKNDYYVLMFDFDSVYTLDDLKSEYVRYSPGYVAPEVEYFPGDIDLHRTDIFSVGAILYEGVFGDVPQDDVQNFGYEFVYSGIDALKSLSPELQPMLTKIFKRTLSIVVSSRFSGNENDDLASRFANKILINNRDIFPEYMQKLNSDVASGASESEQYEKEVYSKLSALFDFAGFDYKKKKIMLNACVMAQSGVEEEFFCDMVVLKVDKMTKKNTDVNELVSSSLLVEERKQSLFRDDQRSCPHITIHPLIAQVCMEKLLPDADLEETFSQTANHLSGLMNILIDNDIITHRSILQNRYYMDAVMRIVLIHSLFCTLFFKALLR